MGCDWYTFTTLIGKGTINTIIGKNVAENTHYKYVFLKENLSISEKEGEIIACEGPVEFFEMLQACCEDDDELKEVNEKEFIIVNFENIQYESKHSVPGPYEIERENRIVNLFKVGESIVLSLLA
jgi:hypothetical protein